MTWSLDSVFVPEDELRRLRELALERYPHVRSREKVRDACLVGEYDHLVKDELRAHRPYEWDQLRSLVERRAVKNLRADGKSDGEIEIRLLMADGEPDRLVTEEELAEILAANPAVAAHEAVQAALSKLTAVRN